MKLNVAVAPAPLAIEAQGQTAFAERLTADGLLAESQSVSYGENKITQLEEPAQGLDVMRLAGRGWVSLWTVVR